MLEREGGRVCALHERGALEREHGVGHGAQGQDLQQRGLLQARLVREGHALEGGAGEEGKGVTGV